MKAKTKKIVPKDFTVVTPEPRAYVYTIKYIKEQPMSEAEETHTIENFSYEGYAEIMRVEAVMNSFDEACDILRNQAIALKRNN